MSDSMPPPDPEVLALLRAESPAPPHVRARARGRLLGAIGPAGTIEARTRDGGAPGAGGGALGAKKAAVIAFLAGGVAGAALHAAWVKPAADRVVYVDRPGPVPAAPPTSGGAVDPASKPGAVVPSDAPAAVPWSPPSGTPSRASQLAAERAMLDGARKAIAEGDAARSLERLERHRRTFASPLLAEERDAMWIQALVKAGRYDEARSRGEAFRKRFPESLFASAVESALGSIP
jgi:hypothetical protein